MAPLAASRSDRAGGRARPTLGAPPAPGPPLGLRALPCRPEEPEPQRRPCISDDLKIGYYSTDHAMQQISRNTRITGASYSYASFNQDLFIHKSIIQAQYEEKLEEQASNLHKDINDRLADIEFFINRI